MTELKFKKGDKILVPFEVMDVDDSCYPYRIDNEELNSDDWCSEELNNIATPLPVIPQFVADYIKDVKRTLLLLPGAFDNSPTEIREWWRHSRKNTEAFALAWIFGYEVEREPVYKVTLPQTLNNKNQIQYLVRQNKNWFFCGNNVQRFKTNHTKKELEDAGFGWVFNQEFAEEVEE